LRVGSRRAGAQCAQLQVEVALLAAQLRRAPDVSPQWAGAMGRGSTWGRAEDSLLAGPSPLAC